MISRYGFSWGDQEKPESNGFRHEADMPCLVVAANEVRCAVLCQAAKEGGWIPISCTDVPSAVANFERILLRLVVVDLHDQHGPCPMGFRDLLQWLASMRDLLIVICGHEGNSQEEIWARQFGPWMYLTGTISATELSVHLKAARQRGLSAVLVELET